MNMADYLLELGASQDVALITNGASYSYRDLKVAAAAIAKKLADSNIGPTDKVGLLGNNSFFWVASYLAILKLRAIAVPFSVTLKPNQLQVRQAFVRCNAMCVDNPAYRRLKSGLPANLPLILQDSLNNESNHSFWQSLAATTDINQDAVYIFTSGTTAQPRVVRLTHRNIQANTNSIIQYLHLSAADRMMAILPFDYCFGASLLHTHLRVGGSLVLSRFLYPETMLDVMENTQCSGLAGVPSVYQTLLRNSSFSRRKLTALRKVQQAGGKLQNVLIKELIAAAPQSQVYVMYGQSEATARLSYLPPELLNSKLGSVGRGIPGVELRVVDKNGIAVTPGQTGQVIARGENISPGYLDDPAATAKKFINGCLKTGDMATIDKDGFITIVDRRDDFLKPLGYRVSSQSIEAHLLELPDVISAAVIGIPDSLYGETIIAYLVLRGGSTLGPTEVIDHCRRGLARYMVPEHVEVVRALPLNSNGKVVKSVLKEKSLAQLAQME